MSEYRIMYKGQNWPSDKDGPNVALAVYRNAEYFQFFIGCVPAGEVVDFGLGAAAQPSHRWYQALAHATLDEVRGEIEAGYAPSESNRDRVTAHFVWPDVARVRQIERGPEPLPTLEEGLFGGQELTTFTVEP
jgi:hypothetical protein